MKSSGTDNLLKRYTLQLSTGVLAVGLSAAFVSHSALAGIEVNPDIGVSTDLNIGVDAKEDLETGIDAGAAAEADVNTRIEADAAAADEAMTDAESKVDTEIEANVNTDVEADIDEDTPTVDNTLMQDADARVEAEAAVIVDTTTEETENAAAATDTMVNETSDSMMEESKKVGDSFIADLSKDKEDPANPANWLISPGDNPGVIEDPELVEGWQRGEANGIAYLTGGVGKESIAAIEPISSQYNLKVLFTTKVNNGYRALVPVWIKSEGQKKLYLVTAGPFLYADLPAGTYDITIDNAISGQTKTVNVTANQRTDVFFSTAVDQGLEQGR